MRAHNLHIPRPLQPYVECIRLVRYDGSGPLAINVCLNGLPGIVFQHHDGRSPVASITTRVGSLSDIPTLYVYGQMTEPGVMDHRLMPFTTIQMILKPHALQSLLGINAAVLTNAVVDLTEFSAGDLNSRLIEAATVQDSVQLMTRFLLSRLEHYPPRDRLIEQSLHLIHRSAASITVRELLDRLHLSERQFEKRFSQAVGVSPHFYIRIKRFNEAIRLMKTQRFATLTDVAHQLNFYDQSHFIRDIRAFSGITPKSLSQKIADIQLDQPVMAYTWSVF